MSDLWTCPECGHRFRWRNTWHSCTHYTVDDHLRGKVPEVVDMYRRYEATVLGLGPDVEIEVVKTYVSFRARMRFAGVQVQTRGLRGALLLGRVTPHPRFVRIESPIPSQHVHRFRIDTPGDLDDTIRGFLAQAYEIGSGPAPYSRPSTAKP